MNRKKIILGLAAILSTAPLALAADVVDKFLSDKQATPEWKAGFNKALLEAELFAAAEAGKKEGEFYLLTDDVKGAKTVYVYTSTEQFEKNPDNAGVNYVNLNGRKLLAMIADTGSDAAINPFSGHGGVLPLAKLKEMLSN